jgi:hypothetical protein
MILVNISTFWKKNKIKLMILENKKPPVPGGFSARISHLAI